jgi:cysteine synthase
MKGSIDKANELNKEIKNSLIAGQFENMANPMAHYLTTGPEIYEDLDGKVDIFVAGIGTGGTISGTGKYLKEKVKDIKIVGVEPSSSPLLTKGISGSHKIQGIGANFIPDTLDTKIYDEVIAVSDEDAYKVTKDIVRSEGVLVGISSGAAIYVAKELAKKEENKDKNIVVILPDTGNRYLSLGLFD